MKIKLFNDLILLKLKRQLTKVVPSILIPVTLRISAFCQNGYIYLHKKVLNETSSPDFTFNLSGDPTAVPAFTNDQAPALKLINGLGTDASGGDGNFPVYYRGQGSASRMSIPGSAVDIDGTYISANAGGRIFYFDGPTQSDVTGNLPVSARIISDNWTGGSMPPLSMDKSGHGLPTTLPGYRFLVR